MAQEEETNDTLTSQQTANEQPADNLLEANKKLENALSALDDKKSKLTKGGKPGAAGVPITHKTTKINTSTQKGTKSNKQTGGNKKKNAQESLQTKTNHLKGDIISEELAEESNENGQQITMETILDPDLRTIEEFDKKTENEVQKWESLLETTDIFSKKSISSGYLTFCKMLGIIPVQNVIESLDTSEIALAHHKIGAKGAQALAEALEVFLLLKYF